jgi:hypothetical protein
VLLPHPPAGRAAHRKPTQDKEPDADGGTAEGHDEQNADE